MTGEGFNYIGKEINRKEHAIFSYLIETSFDPLKAAEGLCQEQSTAQWARVGVKEDFRPAHGAKLIELKVIQKNEKSQLSNSNHTGPFTIAKIKLAHPIINFGAKIPNLITAAAGEGAFFSHDIDAIKLTDVELPESYLKKFEGPRFGVKGIRKKLDVKDRPIFLGVVKPNIGLKPKDFAQLAYEAYLGGLDIAKDDEMLGDTEYSPLKKRLDEVMQKLFKAEDETGEKKLFLANITDEVDRLEELHDLVAGYGSTSIMLNAFPVGLSAARMIAKKTKIPLFSHFDFIAAFSRIPYYGVSSELVTKIERLAGFDAIIMPGFGERMKTPEDEVKANVQACLYDMKGIEKSLPIPGGSDWAGTLKPIYDRVKTIDFAMVPGRGVFNHPQGPQGGARSLRQAWEAIEAEKTIEEYAKTHVELQKAIEAFGKK